MDNRNQTPNTSILEEDVNSPDFHKNIKNEIESDKALLQKNLQVINTLRVEAAELEVETAALYHVEIWRVLDHMKEHTETNKK